jgi:hypothetical protein
MVNRLLKYFGSDYRFIKNNNASDLKKLIGGKSLNIETLKLKNGTDAVFFGYHDKSPFSEDGKKILAGSVPANDKKLSSEGSLMNIGYYDVNFGKTEQQKFHKVTETHSWSWQQSCMLQWNPLKANREIFFNDIIDGSYGSILYDLEKKEVLNKYEQPMYSISPNGKYASSLNFSRLARLRSGYGYSNLPDEFESSAAPQNDGVYLIDLNSGQSELIVSLRYLAKNTDKNNHHYINHINFSPDSNLITFFHIYSDIYSKKIIRFYLYNIVEKELELLEAYRTVSHYCWLSKSKLITSELSSDGTKYFLYNIDQGYKEPLEIDNVGDIHPMVSPVDNSTIVIDTKPDRNSHQHLFLVNLDSKEFMYVDSFFSPPNYKGPVRCDLHPRWDRKGENIAVDSICNGKRCLTVLKLK